jgi:glyoxylase-like metal-dependent hydrolase (beta-lactamase superfamily II)
MRIILAAALLPIALAAQNYPVTQGKTYKFEKVAEGVYYATGGNGSNNVVVVNDADVLLVDDGTTPAAARAFVEDVRALTNKPIRYVVNTHFHYDHTDGNSVFGPDVDIIGHEFVRTAILKFDILHREPFATSQARMPAEERDTIKPTPPNVTYSSKLILNKGQREIQLLFLGRGHTAGDTVVFLPRERLVATGDLMESRLAYMGDAYFDEWVATLEALKKLDFATVLPGHGAPFGDKGLITAFQNYLTDLVKQGSALKKQGVSVEDAAKRVDLTAYSKAFPQIQGPGADLRGMRRLYAWLDDKK